MSAFSDFLVKTILPSIEKVGEGKLVDLLQELHDNDEEKYKATIVAGSAFIKPLAEYVKSTENTIDDGLVQVIQDALIISAARNKIDL
jgi:hypothetical protein